MEQYRSEITTQPKNNNSYHMIDLGFRNIKSLFVLSLKDASNDPTRDSFVEYCMVPVEIKVFVVLINEKSFFRQLIKHINEAYEKLVKIAKKQWLYNKNRIRL